MLEILEHKVIIKQYNSIEELNQMDADLLREARSATKFAYAPYSNFKVGAAAKMSNGEFILGTNQENASYPAGICAERTLLSSASTVHPGISIDTIAISYNNLKGSSDTPASPCGLCRQSLAEFTHRFNHPIRLILAGMEGKVQIIEDSLDLLPLRFGASDLK